MSSYNTKAMSTVQTAVAHAIAVANAAVYDAVVAAVGAQKAVNRRVELNNRLKPTIRSRSRWRTRAGNVPKWMDRHHGELIRKVRHNGLGCLTTADDQFLVQSCEKFI